MKCECMQEDIYCAHDPSFPTLLSQSNENLPAKFNDSLIRNQQEACTKVVPRIPYFPMTVGTILILVVAS